MTEALGLETINPRYMWLDPASGKVDARLRSVRARSAIVVIGTTLDEKVWVLDAWGKRSGTQEMVQTFVQMCIKWSPVVASYEDMGQQSLLWDPILQEADRRNVSIPLSGNKVKTSVEKNWRIRSILQPLIGHGRLMIANHLLELKTEITQFPMSNLKDMIDALAGACSLVPPPKSKSRVDGESRALARWLRESGLPVTDIEAEVGQFGSHDGADYMPSWQRELRNSYSLRI